MAFMMALLAFGMSSVCASTVSLSIRNLNEVPNNIIPNVEYLDLSGNNIQVIDENSFSQYLFLREVNLYDNWIQYIHEGSFSNNAYLTVLDLKSNPIKQLPTSFGLAGQSLQVLQLWDSLNDVSELPSNYFMMFPSLTSLTVGRAPNWQYRWDSAVLPDNLKTLNIAWANLNMFPPVPITVEDLNLRVNNIDYIPETRFTSLIHMITLKLDTNLLTTIPDLYDAPLVTLTLADNPLICNQSLCWIRMWPYLKTPLALDDVTCTLPGLTVPESLMSIHPVDILCYKGNLCSISRSVSNWLQNHNR